MNEKKILFRVLICALLLLTVAFVLLYLYVDRIHLAACLAVVNPVGATLSTAFMLVVGLSVFMVRNKKNGHQ